MMPQVHVLIVCYNSSSTIGNCLAALAMERPASITVLDNASPGGSATVEAECRQHCATFVSSSVNFGFGGGINRLFDELDPPDASLLWIVNPDSFAKPGTLQHLISAIQSGADFALPVITDSQDRVWFSGGYVDPKAGRTVHSNFELEPPDESAPSMPTELISGANFLVRTSTWRALGGFDERLFLYWEDAHLSLRAREMGLGAVLVPAARVAHAQGSSSGGGASPTYYFYVQRNRLLVALWLGRRPISTAFGFGARETLRLLVSPLLRERTQRLQKFIASAAGLLAGLLGQSGAR